MLANTVVAAVVIGSTGLLLGAVMKPHRSPAAPSESAWLSTPGVELQSGEELRCYVTNISDTPRKVRLFMLDRAGQPVKTLTECVLAPGAEARAEVSSRAHSCVFELEGKKADFLGTAVANRPGTSMRRMIEAQ